jgi:hypothetical protein
VGKKSRLRLALKHALPTITIAASPRAENYYWNRPSQVHLGQGEREPYAHIAT